MKVATIIARFPSGFRTIACGEDVGAIKQQFKDIRAARVLEVDEEFADLAVYFDTNAMVKRKHLLAPKTIEQREEINARIAAQEAAQAQANAEAAAVADGSAQAVKVAAKVLTLIADEVAGAGAVSLPATAASPEGAPPESPASAPVPPPTEPAASAPESPAPETAPDGPEGEDGEENHFAPPSEKPKRGSRKNSP